MQKVNLPNNTLEMEEIRIEGRAYDTFGKFTKKKKTMMVVLLIDLDGRYLQTQGLFNMH
jgi:hypothetical protein